MGVVRIHPEVEEPGRGRKSIGDIIEDGRRFRNPYSSVEEYRERQDRFFGLQAQIAEYFGVSRSALEGSGHNLNSLKYQLEELLDGKVRNVFGKLLDKGSVSIGGKNYHDCHGMLTEKRTFRHERLFAFYEEEENRIVLYDLATDDLTDEERAECAQRAFDLYDAFEFSWTHYAKTGIYFRNPYSEFLMDLLEIVGRTNPSLAPDQFHKTTHHGFYEKTDMNVAGLYVPHPSDGDSVVMDNIEERVHSGIIKPSCCIRFTVKPVEADLTAIGRVISIAYESEHRVV